MRVLLAMLFYSGLSDFFYRTRRHFSSRRVLSGMVRSIRKTQVLIKIVLFIPINVVNNLMRLKVSAKPFFHNKAVLINIPVRSFVWVVERLYGNVPILNRSTSLPCGAVRATESTHQSLTYTSSHILGNFFSFIPRLLSNMSNTHGKSKSIGHFHAFVPRSSFWLHVIASFVGVMLATALVSVNPAFAIDEWTKGNPAGTQQAADIDATGQANNNAQDRLLIGYKQGCALVRNSASSLTIQTGEASVPDSSGTVVRYRRLTSNLSVGWASIDTGVEANSTQYYVYLIGDTASTEPTAKISTSSSAPSGTTYYRKIGEFYNDSSGNITNVISYRSDNGSDQRDLAKGWISFTGTGTIAINDSYNVSSITDNGTGDYTVTWTTSFSSANYAIAITSGGNAVSGGTGWSSLSESSPVTTSSVRLLTKNASGTLADHGTVNVIAFGDRT